MQFTFTIPDAVWTGRIRPRLLLAHPKPAAFEGNENEWLKEYFRLYMVAQERLGKKLEDQQQATADPVDPDDYE